MEQLTYHDRPIEIKPMEPTREIGMLTHLVVYKRVPSPALPEEVVGKLVMLCLDAVDAVLDFQLEKELELPEGVTHNGKTTILAHEAIEAFELEEWLA